MESTERSGMEVQIWEYSFRWALLVKSVAASISFKAPRFSVCTVSLLIPASVFLPLSLIYSLAVFFLSLVLLCHSPLFSVYPL